MPVQTHGGTLLLRLRACGAVPRQPRQALLSLLLIRVPPVDAFKLLWRE